MSRKPRIPSESAIYHDRIKELRAKRGISLRELAAISGTSAVHLHDIEHGRKEPSLVKAIAIAKALGCSIAYLTGEDDTSIETSVWEKIRDLANSEIEMLKGGAK